MMEKKARLWKVENDEFIEISPAQLEAEKIPHYLTEEEMYWLMQRMMPQSLQKEEEK